MPRKQNTRKNANHNKKSRFNRKSNRKINKKTRTRKNKSMKKKGKMLKMRGGAIPFSEISTLWDKTLYQFQEFSSPFFDKPTAVAGNASSANPGVTNQFNRVSANSSTTQSPDIKAITERSFSSS